MLTIGITILLLMTAWFVVLFARHEKKGQWPHYGALGVLVILASEILLFARVKFVLLFFTPLVWTGYILFIDAALVKLTTHSRLKDGPGRFLWLVLWSIPLWLTFEAYNLRLKNWAYFNLPENDFLRYLGYAWAFATIWPALFETTDLLQALRIFHSPIRKSRLEPTSRILWSSGLLGLVFLLTPLMVPQPVASYLFGMVWLGFVFALDPVNYRLGKRSLWREWIQGHRDELYAMLLAGLFCGVLWEFWNYWASARWVYVFPIMQNTKIFEMPALGFLGFPPFCVECFVMFELIDFRRPKHADEAVWL